MLLHHVTHFPISGESTTAEVEMTKGASLYLTLMQARSQSLMFDLDKSDVYLNGAVVEKSAWATSPLNKSSRVYIKVRPDVERVEIVELD